jgi:hypothetical protein
MSDVGYEFGSVGYADKMWQLWIELKLAKNVMHCVCAEGVLPKMLVGLGQIRVSHIFFSDEISP